ncbi:uncharacterized protein LOC134294378 isoform X1 [Anolis carolinensis]|uniref:uncharacterized protein LOC134294378 isoform X1 n=1 Tax=Anolis carolinensis TaxID=28377 RepID=UPI002F2B6933
MVKENAGTGGSFPCPCCRRSRKNAKVTTMLGERQIKAGSHSLACWMLSGGSSTRTMLHLLLASGFLTGALLWAAPRETDLDQDPRMGSTVLALNGSCREQVLQRIGQSLLRLLHLDRAPRFPAETTVQLRQTWAKEVAEAPALSAEGQTLNISPNETLLIQRGGCAQISHHITLTERLLPAPRDHRDRFRLCRRGRFRDGAAAPLGPGLPLPALNGPDPHIARTYNGKETSLPGTLTKLEGTTSSSSVLASDWNKSDSCIRFETNLKGFRKED